MKRTLTKEEQFKLDAANYAETSIASIREMVEALDAAGSDDTKREDAERTIHEDALEVQVRSDWHSVMSSDDSTSAANKPTEYYILLTTGGPAARVIGELDEYGLPENARFEYQDWFQPWTDVPLKLEDSAVLLRYAQQFYFGEG